MSQWINGCFPVATIRLSIFQRKSLQKRGLALCYLCWCRSCDFVDHQILPKNLNVLFDLDGTLTDPFEGITRCISHAMVSLGRMPPSRKELKWCIGPPLKNSFATLLNVTEQEFSLAEEALLIYRERFASTGLYENKVYEGIPTVLNEMQKSGHILYVATAKPMVFAQQILAHFQLDHYFKEIYGSELDGTRSDKTSLIRYILAEESINPVDTWMIGDRKHDMIGARNNHVAGAGVCWGYGSRKELRTAGARVVFDRPYELMAFFAEYGEKPGRL